MANISEANSTGDAALILICEPLMQSKILKILKQFFFKQILIKLDHPLILYIKREILAKFSI